MRLDLLVSSHDYIADLHSVNHGTKFKSFREWSGPKYTAFMEQIINYANYVKDQRNEEPEGGEVEPAPVLFKAGPGDLPLLPAPVHGARSTEIARHAKDVIRAHDDILMTYALHANGYVTKPLDLHEFMHAVKTIAEFWFTTAHLPSRA